MGLPPEAGAEAMGELYSEKCHSPTPARDRSAQTTWHASSQVRRGERECSLLASPWPRLHRKLDFTVVPAKNAASTLALSKPDIGPQSRPSDRAASMKYAPCSDEFRSAMYSSTDSGKSLNHAFASACGNNLGSCSKKWTSIPRMAVTGAFMVL